MKKLKEYKVYYSAHANAKVKAYSAKGAREQAWSMIKDGFTYGWHSKNQFMEDSKVERLK